MSKKQVFAALLAVMIVVLAQVGLTSAQDDAALPATDLTNPAAPFIYSHDYAIQQGASAEWRKLEGVAMDATNNMVYFAVTAVARGMSDAEGGIQLPENKCGAVFGGSLDGDFNVAALNQIVVGGPFDEANTDYSCSPDSIASPDNIFVDPQGNLWIGEDTDYHLNQMLWMWNGTELKRFATMPAGAEVTGLRIESDGTIFLNIQHPADTNPAPYNRGTIGVITGFHAGDDFESVPVAESDAITTLTLAAGEYQVLARSGDAFPGSPDVVGNIPAADGTSMGTCNNPDGNMYLPTDDASGVLYTNWECSPGGVSMLAISHDADGNWSATSGAPVDFSALNGTWNNCNASVTPWNTALTSEEYPADTQGEWEDGWLPTRDAMAAHLGHAASPLDYGFPVELIPAADGSTITARHYVMGRFSHEMDLVMPDNRTVYAGDDGTDRVLYKFVADTAGDLSAGTLYAAAITTDGETLNLEWIALGSGNDSDIAAALQELNAAYTSGM